MAHHFPLLYTTVLSTKLLTPLEKVLDKKMIYAMGAQIITTAIEKGQLK